MSELVAATSWESDLAALLARLSAVQGELLSLLARKRALLIATDTAGLAAMQAEEESLLARLQGCHEQRAKLLARAADEGLPGDSVRSLAGALPRAQRGNLTRQVQEAASRARLLRHQSLTNWVLVQRTLLHLSQLIEIIATGGRPQPTYGSAPSSCTSGALVDQAA